MLGALVFLAATASPGPAERAATAALARVRAIDPRIHAVVALDPTAIVQARGVCQTNPAGGAVG